MALDPEPVARKARLILEDLARLEPLAAMAPDVYLADFKNELVAERLLRGSYHARIARSSSWRSVLL